MLLAYEATADLALEETQVETPMGTASGLMLREKIGLVPILRAGLGMVDGVWEMMPSAEVWHIGLYRDEKTLRPVEYYNKLPVDPTVQVCLILDPMLATGGSAVATVNISSGGRSAHQVCGHHRRARRITALHRVHPDIPIHIGAVDSHLNDIGFIVPGLGTPATDSSEPAEPGPVRRAFHPPEMPFFIVFAVSFILALALSPLSMSIGRRFQTVDRPGGRRAHAGAVPRTGGLALFGGFMGGTLLVFALWPPANPEDTRRLAGVAPARFSFFSLGCGMTAASCQPGRNLPHRRQQQPSLSPARCSSSGSPIRLPTSSSSSRTCRPISAGGWSSP